MQDNTIWKRLGLSAQCKLSQMKLWGLTLGSYEASVPHYRFSPIQLDPPDWISQPRPEIAVGFNVTRPYVEKGDRKEFMRLSFPTTPFSWEKRLAVLAELAELIRTERTTWTVASLPFCPLPQQKQIEHIPIALVDDDQEIRWINPAAKAHGLVHADFPLVQHQRCLGDEIPWDQYEDAYAISAEDESTGLPVWFLATKNELASFDIPESDLTRSIIRFHATRCARLQKSRARRPFVEIAVQEYLSTYKRYFAVVPQTLAQGLIQ